MIFFSILSNKSCVRWRTFALKNMNYVSGEELRGITFVQTGNVHVHVHV